MTARSTLWPLLMLLLVGWALFATAALAARLKTVAVTATGSALSRDEAITDALVQAVNQVNGRVISEHTVALSLRAAVRARAHATGEAGTLADTRHAKARWQGAAHLSADGLTRFVKSQTHGAIRSYSVVRVHKNDRGGWTASIRALVTKFQRPQAAMRRRIAILPVRYTPKTCPIAGHRESCGAEAALLSQSITDSLTGTRKFAVLDRQHDKALNRELALIRDAQARSRDQALLGQRLIADYVLVTRIEHMGYFIHTTHFLDTSRTLRRADARIVVGFQLIDPVTSEVVDAATLRASLSGAQLRRFGRTGSVREIAGTLARYAGQRLVKAIVNDLYPVMIIDASGNRVVIAEGGGTLRPGQTYRVYRYGKALRDPYTGESLGREEHYCCKVKITRTEPAVAYGKVRDSAGIFQKRFIPDTFILRSIVNTRHWSGSAEKIRKLRRIIRHENALFSAPGSRSSH